MRTEEELYVETNYQVLYEDDWFFVVDKPAPLPVHPVGRFKHKNLLSLLRKDFPQNADELRMVNRLDSETSGLVIVARSQEAAGRLGTLFEKRLVSKEYTALVLGVPALKKGTVSISLGTTQLHSQRVRVPDPDGETAVTHYEVLEDRGNYSLLKIVPETGRTHQIRAHLAFLGHPIAGDKIYIDPSIFERYIQKGWQEDMRPVVRAKRLLLHATRLEFLHPETNQLMKFFSPAPFVVTASPAAGRARQSLNLEIISSL